MPLHFFREMEGRMRIKLTCPNCNSADYFYEHDWRVGVKLHCVACHKSALALEWKMLTNTAREPILIEREKTHGDFKTTAIVSQALKNVVRDWDTKGIPARQKEALEMICLKMARALGNPKVKDHWDDIAGYAKLGSEACDG